MSEQKKPHLSTSAVGLFLRCGEAWRRRYMEGHIIRPKAAMVIGTGVHEGAQVNFRQKIESHDDLPAGQIIEASVAALESRVEKEGIQLEGKSLADTVGEAKDIAAVVATHHAAFTAPAYQPTMVERQVRLELPKCSRDLVGVVDLVDDKSRVIDFKTTGRRKNQQEADESLQLTTYAVLHHKATGKLPESMILDVTMRPDKKHVVKRETFETTRDKEDIKILAATLSVVNDAIDKGSFAPAPQGSWWCSDKWCGYHAECPFVRHKKKQGD